MEGFEFIKLELDGAYLISSFHAGDERGSFTKCFEKDIYAKAGIELTPNETFVSASARNVIRGLHFQIHNPQAKLVCIVTGRVWDVIVDLRSKSKTFGKWTGIELSAENHRSLYIPRGFAHGFAALEDNTVMLYQCDGVYDKETDSGIRFDDPEIGITWPINDSKAIYSERDSQLMSLRDYMKHPMELDEDKKL